MLEEWIAAGVLGVACGAGLAYWSIVAWRIAVIARARPSVRAGLSRVAAEDQPAVSIVVPVHDEERVIDACAASLRAQSYPDLQFIFVLDRCRDGTKAILERHAGEDDRIRIVENEACPEDWAGKCHAAHLGAEQARGALLLFTDADTEFDPRLVAAAVRVLAARELDLLSLLSTLTYTRRFERVAQPVASIQLVRQFPIVRVSDRVPIRPFANGQFMLFRRAAYEGVDGHAGVREALLEDLAFARAVDAAGGATGVVLADGMLRCSMYDSFAAFRLGWKRIFIEACRRRPKRLRSYALRILVQGVGLPLTGVASVATGLGFIAGGARWPGSLLLAVALALIIVATMTLARIYAMSGAPRRALVWYPIGSAVVAAIMLRGARDLVRRRAIPWAGRSYVLEPRF